MTPIEKLREQVEEVRREHAREGPSKHNAFRAICRRCDYGWPCPTLSWAEKCLRLAEALDWLERHAANGTDRHVSKRVLAEVTR